MTEVIYILMLTDAAGVGSFVSGPLPLSLCNAAMAADATFLHFPWAIEALCYPIAADGPRT